MNNARRKNLDALMARAKLTHAQVEELKSDLEDIRDEEQEYRDGMPESIGNGDKGAKADAAIEALDAAIEAMQEALDAFDELENQVSTAKE